MRIALILLIIVAIGIVIFFISKKKPKKILQVVYNNQPKINADTPVSFGYKCMWIAVRTNNKEKNCRDFRNKKHPACKLENRN